ncbi:MAG: DNRLRE domain-containing protein [Anaerolineales bacterium]|nr:DNRLRE domain-containing protein [Anaerolineales bacterium]
MINYFRSLNIKFSKANFNRVRTNSRIIIMILVLACSLVGKSPASVLAAGTTYYVDNTNRSCSDIGSGTTVALPFCKIGRGASAVSAGDTVQVLAGSYAETVTVPKSGSVGLPITYAAAPGVTVSGNGLASGGNAFRISTKSYIIINGFAVTGTADNGIYVSGSNHITISNNHISYSGKPKSGSTRAGIYLTGTIDSLITGNTTDHNTQDGIRLTTGAVNNTVSNNISFANAEQWQRNATGIHVNGSGSYNNIIIQNITYANEDTGLQFYSNTHNNFIIGNLTYGNGDHGIDFLNSPYNMVIGNTVQGNHTSGINLEGSGAPGSSGAKVMNNISVDNGIAPITGQKSNIRVDARSVSGTIIDYNLVYLTSSGTVQIQWKGVSYSTLAAFKAAVPTQEVHGLQANPLFIAPVPPAGRPPVLAVGDYHVKAGSPVIDSANAGAPNEPLLDLDGNARIDDLATVNTGDGLRTYDDRGAYEFQPVSGAFTATPTATPTSTLIPTTTLSPTPTFTPTNTPVNTPTATFTNTPTAGPSQTPTITFTPSNTPLPPTATATLLPTATFTATPTTGAGGSTLTFIASADSYVRDASPTSNYGMNVQLWVDSGTNENYEGHLMFTVSGVSEPVQSATLRVYSTSSTVDGPAVYATTNNWTETGITWNTRPARTSAGLDDKGAIATGVWVEYNVTALMTGDGSYSFVLVMTSTDAISFSTHEGSQPPQLILKIGY